MIGLGSAFFGAGSAIVSIIILIYTFNNITLGRSYERKGLCPYNFWNAHLSLNPYGFIHTDFYFLLTKYF